MPAFFGHNVLQLQHMYSLFIFCHKDRPSFVASVRLQKSVACLPVVFHVLGCVRSSFYAIEDSYYM